VGRRIHSMNESSRILKYWVKNSQKVFLMTIGMAACFILYQLILGVDSQLFGESSMIPGTLIGCGIITIMIFTISYGRIYITTAISFGSTRREAFKGLQISNVILIVETLILFFIIYTITGDRGAIFTRTFGLMLLMYIGLLLLMDGVGQICSAVLSNYGNKGIVVAIIVIGFCAGIVFGVFIFANGTKIQSILESNVLISECTILLGVIFYIAGFFITRKNIKTLVINS
jgi:hypothetical protein